MSDFRLVGGMDWELAGQVEASTTGTSLPSGTPGAWVQLSAATARETTGIWVMPSDCPTQTTVLVDVGVGASGSEQVVLPAVTRVVGPGTVDQPVFFPASIPAGSRVAARLAFGAVAAKQYVGLVSEGFAALTPGGRVTAYAINNVITAPTADNTKSAWTQIIAATTNAMSFMVFGVVSNIATTQMVDIAVGASGFEQVVVKDMFVQAVSAGLSGPYYAAQWQGVPLSIPAGTRLAVRCQQATHSATTNTCSLYGIE